MTTVSAPESLCRFGIARRDVTPPMGIYHRMWGAAAHDRSEGVHRPLTATAVVLQSVEDSRETQCLVAVDHCLLFPPEMEALLDRVTAATRMTRDDLLVVFSHTHAAGLMEERRSELPGGEMIAPYLRQLAAEIAAAVNAAAGSMQPVTLTYATGRCGLAANRDFFDAESGQYVCGFHPAGESDDTLLVARVCDEEGRLVATFVNYACHPTTLAWDNRLISPDFVGAMRETVEDVTHAPCVFLQGTSGDLGPREGFVGEVEVADRNGRELGYSALAALNSIGPPRTNLAYAGAVISGATIGTWERRPLAVGEQDAARRWQRGRWTVPLRYREGLPTTEQVRDDLARFQAEERAARAAGDTQSAADARALVERQTRKLARLSALPAGAEYPFPLNVLRLGNAIWLTVEGEPYQQLQRALRQRFPDFAVIVMELANGSRIGYLPTAETYGTGIYQESIALLASGSLETLTSETIAHVDSLLTSDSLTSNL